MKQPLYIPAASAALDRSEKKCLNFRTDGEELKNSRAFCHRERQCSISFPPSQGQAPAGRLVFPKSSGSESKNSRIQGSE